MDVFIFNKKKRRSKSQVRSVPSLVNRYRDEAPKKHLSTGQWSSDLNPLAMIDVCRV